MCGAEMSAAPTSGGETPTYTCAVAACDTKRTRPSATRVVTAHRQTENRGDDLISTPPARHSTAYRPCTAVRHVIRREPASDQVCPPEVQCMAGMRAVGSTNSDPSWRGRRK